MRHAIWLALGFLALAAPAAAQSGPPHDWLFGSWTGGLFPPVDADSPACLRAPTVIFTSDVVLRASSLDVAYRQRTVETVGATASGVEFRFAPAIAVVSPLGARVPQDSGFGCPGGANVLRVERRGPNEIFFPGCDEFPGPLKRCSAR
jgi:hypothetical protein